MFGFIIIVLFFILLFVELHKSKTINKLIEKNVKKAIKKFPKSNYERKRWLIPLISVLAASTVLTIIYVSALMHFNSKVTFFEAILTQFTLYAFLIPLIIYVIFIVISVKNNNLYDIKNISEFIKRYFEMNVERIQEINGLYSINLSKKYEKNNVEINVDYHQYIASTIGATQHTPLLTSLSLEINTVFEHEMAIEFYENLSNELEKIHSVKVEYYRNQILCIVEPNSAKNNIYYIYLILQTIDKFLQLS